MIPFKANPRLIFAALFFGPTFGSGQDGGKVSFRTSIQSLGTRCCLALCAVAHLLLLSGCMLLETGCDVPATHAVGASRPEPDFPELGLNRGEKIYTGKMSWYSIKTNGGTKTASGERFCDKGDTAAHPTLPFGTFVEVTNLSNEKTAVLRITDRGPYKHGRIIDVSVGAAKKLDFVGRGVTECRVQVLTPVEEEAEETEGESREEDNRVVLASLQTDDGEGVGNPSDREDE